MPKVRFTFSTFNSASGTLTETSIILVNEILAANEPLSAANTAGDTSALGRTPTTKEIGGPRGVRSVGVEKEHETTVPSGAEHES
ncbi:unannotated protein [freshwater metagenome]|uniref:Unannotated protein n=1 Tax=freshwater metagenome TaxID=449393 RepID=A0A6J7K6V8_9ZZZZ